MIKKRDSRNVNDENGRQISEDGPVLEKLPTSRRGDLGERIEEYVSSIQGEEVIFSYITDKTKHSRKRLETDDSVDGGKREYL